MNLATGRIISKDNIEVIRNNIITFLRHYEADYQENLFSRVTFWKPVFHQLLHVADCITDLGPMWSYWQFPCERFCGTLVSSVRSRSKPDRNLSLNTECQELRSHLQYTMQSPQLDIAAEVEDSIWCEVDSDNEDTFGLLLDDDKEELNEYKGNGLRLWTLYMNILTPRADSHFADI